jgi:hypothetical protein
MVEEIFSAAVLAGFTKAISGSFEHMSGNVPESVRKDQIDMIIKAASAFGLEKPVEDELKRFVPDAPKPQVRPRTISMNAPGDSAREWIHDTHPIAGESVDTFQEAA